MEIGVVSGSGCWRKTSWGKRKRAGEEGKKMRNGRAVEGDSGVASLKCGPWEAGRVVCYPPLHASTVGSNSLHWNSWIWSRAERTSPAVSVPAHLSLPPQAWLSGEGFWNPAALSAPGTAESLGPRFAWCPPTCSCQNGLCWGEMAVPHTAQSQQEPQLWEVILECTGYLTGCCS